MPHTKKLLFIGGGNIAGAVACGLVNSHAVDADCITVYDIDVNKLSKFSDIGMNISDDLNKLDIAYDYIFLAVKPSIVKSVMQQLSELDNLCSNAVFVSFAAAVTIGHITQAYGRDIPVIRTMPSTPILIGEGVLAVTRNELVPAKAFQFFCRILSNVAHVTTIEEELMNPIISVHGSSPAYVYLFVKAMLDAAVAQGVNREDALPLILKTVKGSVSMIEKSNKSIEQLISDVASPNGTTLAALNKFEEMNFSGIVNEAMSACTKRANEISEEL